MLDLNIALQNFDAMLAVGESCTGAVYGVFKPKGFLAGAVGNQVHPGYMAVTNIGRLLTIRTGSLGYFTGDNRVVCYDLSRLTKLTMHKNIFGQCVFNRRKDRKGALSSCQKGRRQGTPRSGK